MTTREEWAEACKLCEEQANHCSTGDDDLWLKPTHKEFELAARVLRALADGAVLCYESSGPYEDTYHPIDPQP